VIRSVSLASENEGRERDIRPAVGGETGNRPLWIGIVGIAVLGLLLFLVLDGNRRANVAPAVRPDPSDMALASPTEPPQLYVPQDFGTPYPVLPAAGITPTRLLALPVPVRVLSRPSPDTGASPPLRAPTPPTDFKSGTGTGDYLSLSTPAPLTRDVVSDAVNTSSAIIVDGGIRVGTPDDALSSSSVASDKSAAMAMRPTATRSGFRALIIPQGTLISAVLETGLDSTQPGQARALVSADVRAFRSTRVLIPRGSRLFGSYQGELAAGQNRILVQWARLVRPDGVTIAIDSPASDRLGRAGIKGNLRTHFWQRLGNALLQSTIDIGSILASRGSSNSTVLVTVPGRVSGVASDLVGTPPKPSISVKPGTQISVFVVRDLDFSAVES
jgi:type IV secretion system protein VirB10